MSLRWMVWIGVLALAACGTAISCPGNKAPQWVADSAAPGGWRIECR